VLRTRQPRIPSAAYDPPASSPPPTYFDKFTSMQPALSSAGADKWVLSWRLNEASDSSGDRRAVGSRFQVLRGYKRENVHMPLIEAHRTASVNILLTVN